VSETKKVKILKEVLGDFYREGHSQCLFFCPRCGHHKKKLSINIGKNLFKCWVCDWSGKDIYRVVRRYGDYRQKQEWRSLSQQVEINDFVDKIFGRKEEVRPEPLELPKDFISLVNKDLPVTSLYPLNYLRSREIRNIDIAKWKIGYCTKGKYASRIVVPSFSITGDINYFVARSYDGDWRKYLNPGTSSDIIFNELFLDFDDEVILVEGIFDAIKAGHNSIPLLGSTLNENSILLQKIVENDSSVYLALDADASKKANKIIDLLLKYDIEIFKVDIHPYKDVGEMPKHVFKERKQSAVFLNSDNYLLSKIIGI
jgi:DNA primase